VGINPSIKREVKISSFSPKVIILQLQSLATFEMSRIFRKMINMIMPFFLKNVGNPRCFSQGDQHDHRFSDVCHNSYSVLTGPAVRFPT
jgi:hypothetical protein